MPQRPYKACDFLDQFKILWCPTTEASMRHGFEHMQLRRNAHAPQRAVQPSGIRQKQIPRTRLNERRGKSLEIAEQGGKVGVREIGSGGVEAVCGRKRAWQYNVNQAV